MKFIEMTCPCPICNNVPRIYHVPTVYVSPRHPAFIIHAKARREIRKKKLKCKQKKHYDLMAHQVAETLVCMKLG